jgi:hypothetical protein
LQPIEIIHTVEILGEYHFCNMQRLRSVGWRSLLVLGSSDCISSVCVKSFITLRCVSPVWFYQRVRGFVIWRSPSFFRLCRVSLSYEYVSLLYGQVLFLW